MDFRFSEEQQLLRESLTKFLTKEYAFASRAQILKSGGYSAQMWRRFAEFGWLSGPFFDDSAAAADHNIEAMIIMEEFGRHLVLEPFLWTTVIGGRLIWSGLRGERRAALCQELTDGALQIGIAVFDQSGGHDGITAMRKTAGFRLTGELPVVYAGQFADKFIVVARSAQSEGSTDRLTLFLINNNIEGLTARHFATLDGRPISALTLDDVLVDESHVLGQIDNALPLLNRAIDDGVAALCAQAVGSMTYLLEATVAHLKAREQYGAPLARLQALQHRMADMYVALELSRSMSLVATNALEAPARERSAYVSAAKLQITRSARVIGQQAVQLHGGMGMSEELDVAHHFTFLTSIGTVLGDEHEHLTRFSRLAEQLDSAGVSGFSSEGLPLM